MVRIQAGSPQGKITKNGPFMINEESDRTEGDGNFSGMSCWRGGAAEPGVAGQDAETTGAPQEAGLHGRRGPFWP